MKNIKILGLAAVLALFAINTQSAQALQIDPYVSRLIGLKDQTAGELCSGYVYQIGTINCCADVCSKRYSSKAGFEMCYNLCIGYNS